MAENLRVPPPRNLDIYRLVVARGLKQTDVALLFSVSPVRICQIVRRVRLWVDGSIGDWLFPRRDDLRYYAALEAAQIRVYELDNDPENVLFTGPAWTYRRQVGGTDFQPVEQGPDGRATAATTTAGTATSATTKPLLSATSLSPAPLHLLPSASEATIGATASAANDFVPSHINDLAHRLAELLILWQKSRRLTGAFKSSSFAAGWS